MSREVCIRKKKSASLCHALFFVVATWLAAKGSPHGATFLAEVLFVFVEFCFVTVSCTWKAYYRMCCTVSSQNFLPYFVVALNLCVPFALFFIGVTVCGIIVAKWLCKDWVFSSLCSESQVYWAISVCCAVICFGWLIRCSGALVGNLRGRLSQHGLHGGACASCQLCLKVAINQRPFTSHEGHLFTVRSIFPGTVTTVIQAHLKGPWREHPCSVWSTKEILLSVMLEIPATQSAVIAVERYLEQPFLPPR